MTPAQSISTIDVSVIRSLITRAGSHNLQRLYHMSNNDYLRPVSSPPALASATTRGLLPSSLGSELLIALPNEWRRQALHVCQLLGGASQLQSPFTDSLGNPNHACFGLKPFEFGIDTGQVVVQFLVACDICSDTPVIKSVGCFGKVSVNCGGADK